MIKETAKIIPSTLWVQFEDEQVGQLHHQEYINTIMVMKLIIHGHPYLHSTEKQLYVIVELLELNFH